MVQLSDLDLAFRYRSSENDLLTDFYLPCLRVATSYSRAVGYFSSYSLAAAADGLPAFIAHDGVMRLIASPDLSDDDVAAINEGYRARDEVVSDALVRSILEDHPDPIRERLGFLAWLVEHDRLEIKIALMISAEPGIYHEKIGVFADEVGNLVSFQGSANESRGGLVSNFESILVFRSGVPGQADLARSIAEDFERLWTNRTPKLQILDFPEAAKRELLTRYTPSTSPVPVAPAEEHDDLALDEHKIEPGLRADKPLRDYQREAMACWFRADGRGMLQMATGTGKTVTALSLVITLYEALAEKDRSLLVVILCPFQHLVSQWGEEIREFGMQPLLCFRSRSTWEAEFAAQIAECRSGSRALGVAVATNATFQSDAFQRLAAEIPETSLLIADEVHNVGAPRLRALLPGQVRYRLGLSATPERWYDDEGTAALRDYFGDVVYELGLERAIELGALTRYDYYPIVVELNGSELESYLELTNRIVMRMRQTGTEAVDDGDPVLEALLIRRARILSLAQGKLAKLEQVARPLAASSHNLFYCGDGEVEYEPAGDTIRQLDAVVHLLGRGLGMSVDSYTAETFLAQRDDLRQRFATGELQGLVAIRCLDEGVDIPETRRAFILASSTNPKQFIQRRGRILRPYPGKEKAEIYDFLTVPPADAIGSEFFSIERRLVRRELERVALFARLASNGPQALGELEPLRKTYNLLHIA
jgi:DNA phosphorothioation system restriction enzyme